MKTYGGLIRHSGNLELFRAVEMSVAGIINDTPFHIHAEGLRGTGKTSIMRAAKEILPRIVRIKGCIYNCDPQKPHCPEHAALGPEDITALGMEEIPCPFLEISHAAKIGTIIGSIDLAKLTDPLRPGAALLPGTIPQAHRGIIFVDEINRLADTSPEIADVLLSVMGTKPGKVQIEESGLPVVEFPIIVSIWAASNPDEEPGGLSQIRRQLADRFDMVVTMGRPNDYETVAKILDGEEAFQKAHVSPLTSLNTQLHTIKCDLKMKAALACVYVDFGLESLRALEALENGARLNALLAGRQFVEPKDLLAVAPQVLGHRTDCGTLANILKYLESLDKTQEKHLLPPITQENKYPMSANPAIQPDVSWLKKLWQRLSRLKSSTKQTQGRSETTGKNNQTAAESQKQAAKPENSGGAQSAMADPLKTNIISPASKATPLAQMHVEEFVSEGENKPHGRTVS